MSEDSEEIHDGLARLSKNIPPRPRTVPSGATKWSQGGKAGEEPVRCRV